jgi:hypothetical protein
MVALDVDMLVQRAVALFFIEIDGRVTVVLPEQVPRSVRWTQ